MLHYSQTELSDLKLETDRVKPNEKFRLKFSLKGTFPEFTLTFDDKPYELSFNEATGEAVSDELPGILF